MRRSSSKAERPAHSDAIHEMLARANSKATTFRDFPELLADEMELLHGKKFRVVVDHDTPMILIRLA